MRTTIIIAALTLALGCGTEETQKPQEQAKAPSKPALPDSNIGQLKVDPTKHERFLWEFETGDIVLPTPAIGSDGTVYVGSKDHRLYAIKTDSKGLAKSPWPMRGQNAQHTGRTPAK